jgi:hypothetical protein
MSEVVNIEQRHRAVAAMRIAEMVDPLAGGWFKLCLQRAALLGMEWFEKTASPPSRQDSCEDQGEVPPAQRGIIHLGDEGSGP